MLSIRTVTHTTWDGYVGEEVVLPLVGARLGVGCRPCRFQRAAGLWVLEEKIFSRGGGAQAVEVCEAFGPRA